MSQCRWHDKKTCIQIEQEDKARISELEDHSTAMNAKVGTLNRRIIADAALIRELQDRNAELEDHKQRRFVYYGSNEHIDDLVRSIERREKVAQIVRSWSCCPMCREVRCDDDCPLLRVREAADATR